MSVIKAVGPIFAPCWTDACWIVTMGYIFVLCWTWWVSHIVKVLMDLHTELEICLVVVLYRRGPALGGSKSAVSRQMSVCQPVF